MSSMATTERRWNRSRYPLQMPLQISAMSSKPIIRSHMNNITITPNERSSLYDELDQHRPHAAEELKANRQGYSLQASASRAPLEYTQTPPSSVLDSEPEQKNTTQAGKHSAGLHRTKSGNIRAQAYPLQSFSATAGLQYPLSPPPSPETASRYSAQNSKDHVIDDMRSPISTNTSQRQAYPLQSRPSLVNLQHCPSVSSSVNEDQSTHRRPDFQQRENTLPVEHSKPWPSPKLPLQSPSTGPKSDSAPHTHQDVPLITYEQQRTNAIHIPKHIRAATHSDKHDQSNRTIVVCLDGTGDKFDNDNSNIVHIVSALKKDDQSQVTYYQAGIGTYGEGGLSGGFSAAMDMAFGSGLGMHIREAYHFLMHTYKEGDKICIFGFSRGAYTARCLAGMIHKVGLLPARNVQQIPFAYEFYKDGTPQGWQRSEDFKSAFCIDVNVYFLGCFDSVASVGFIPRHLPLSSTPKNKPHYFRHAMALDERRVKFDICRHQKIDWADIQTSAAAEAKLNQDKWIHANVTHEEYEELTAQETPSNTNVREVWFAGAHADVGGGAVANAERHKLAQIPLRWMIRQAFECNTGIIFKAIVLAEYGLDVHTLWPVYRRLNIPDQGPTDSLMDQYDRGLSARSIRSGKLVLTNKFERGEQLFRVNAHTDRGWTPEQLEDRFDAISPINDQLVQAPNWWILEFLPVKYRVPTASGTAINATGMNLGRYRAVEDAEPNVHWTVLYRSQHMGYKIQARIVADSAWQPTV